MTIPGWRGFARPRDRGFTLIELLVVFAILAVLVGLTPVAFDRFRDSSQYRDTVRTVLSQLRTARHQAVAEGREVLFTIDLTRRVYGTDGAALRSLPSTVDLRATVAGTEMARNAQASIRFLPSGGATGGSIDVLRSNGAGTRLRVDWLSGRVTQEAVTR